MSGPDCSVGPRDCGADVPGYVLGALDRVDAELFRRHVDSCAVCRDEVVALTAIADSLALAVPQLRAPKSLKRRTLACIHPDACAGPAQRPAWLRLGSSRPAVLPTVSIGRRGALVAGGLLAAAAIGVGGISLASRDANGIRDLPAAVIDQGRFANAVLHVESGHAELLLSRMPAPPTGKIYEVWLERHGGEPQPTSALFSVTSHGAATVDVPGNLTGVSEVLVTPEPAGGSLVPTQPPVIVAPLAS
jgi:anti-sigma-K factor RskA